MKFKNLIMVPILALCLCLSGCELTYYTPESEKSTNNNDRNNINDSDINVINSSNYTGSITYADSSLTRLTTEQVYAKCVTSTVYIINTTSDGYYLGSGVFFSEDSQDDGYAYLFTNAHVVENASKIEIVYSNYKRDTATIVGYHLLEDVAVLAVKKNSNYTIATVQTSDKLSIASEVVTIGTPISSEYSFTATSGIISKIDSPLSSYLDDSYNLLLLQIDASLNQGNSGGPLFDMYGNLIGLNTMKLVYDENYNNIDDFNFAIPVDRALYLANRFFNNQPYTRGLLGVTVYDIADLSLDDRKLYNITLEYGLYVIEPTYNSSPILKGDIITKINGVSFLTKIAFQKELYKYAKGETVTITVYRNNTYQELNMTLQ